MSAKQTINTLATSERTICNGAVVLFKRKNSQRWQARIRRNAGEWVVYSTKQKDFEKASAIAEDKFRGIEYAQRTGKIDVTRKFSSVCQFCRKELLEKAEHTNTQLPKDLVQVQLINDAIPVSGRNYFMVFSYGALLVNPATISVAPIPEHS